MDQLTCPDGFLIEPGDRLRDAHEQINLWLVGMEDAEARRPNSYIFPDARQLKKQFRPQHLSDLLEASLVRTEAAPSAHGTRLRAVLLGLMRAPHTLDDERLWWPREEVCDLIEAEFQRRDLGAPVWRLIRRLHDGMATDNSISGQTARRRLAVMLWHDPHDEIDPKRCWSEVIRRDLRASPEPERRLWSAAFRSIVVSDSTEPPKSFQKTAESHIAAIGAGPFRDRLGQWFVPFRAAEPVRLTMVGSHMLKGLLWYARLVRDESIDAAVLSLLNTKWRSKEFLFRPLTVLAGSVAQFPAEEAWPILLRIHQLLGSKASARFTKQIEEVGAKLGLGEADLKQQNLIPPPAQKQTDYVGRMLRMFERINWGSRAEESRFHYTGDYIEIRGARDRYRAHTPSCTIRRLRDNALVELDYSRVPDYWLVSRDDVVFQIFSKMLFALTMDDEYDFFLFRQT